MNLNVNQLDVSHGASRWKMVTSPSQKIVRKQKSGVLRFFECHWAGVEERDTSAKRTHLLACDADSQAI